MYIGTPLNGFKLRFASNLDLMFKTRFQLKYVYAIDNFSEKAILHEMMMPVSERRNVLKQSKLFAPLKINSRLNEFY